MALLNPELGSLQREYNTQIWRLGVCPIRYAPPANGIGSNELADSIPVVMAGVLAIYGLVVSIMIANTLRPETHLFTAFVHLGARIAGWVFN